MTDGKLFEDDMTLEEINDFAERGVPATVIHERPADYEVEPDALAPPVDLTRDVSYRGIRLSHPGRRVNISHVHSHTAASWVNTVPQPSTTAQTPA